MIAEAAAGLSALKTAFDLAKGLKDIHDATSRNAVVIELQEKILGAQAAQSALIDRVSELEKEMARLETWEAEKQRYKLTQCAPGAFAYVLKQAEARGEPGHAICAYCYERRIKSIIQSNGEPQIFKHAWTCPTCKSAMKTGGENLPEFAD